MHLLLHEPMTLQVSKTASKHNMLLIAMPLPLFVCVLIENTREVKEILVQFISVTGLALNEIF
jgi:hypothetical protein